MRFAAVIWAFTVLIRQSLSDNTTVTAVVVPASEYL
jgi:hypothetical protein